MVDVHIHQLLNIVPTETGFNVIGVVGCFPYKSSFFPQTLGGKSSLEVARYHICKQIAAISPARPAIYCSYTCMHGLRFTFKS